MHIKINGMSANCYCIFLGAHKIILHPARDSIFDSVKYGFISTTVNPLVVRGRADKSSSKCYQSFLVQNKHQQNYFYLLRVYQFSCPTFTKPVSTETDTLTIFPSKYFYSKHKLIF
jgi:hypothetical protein